MRKEATGSPHELAGSPPEPAGSPGERINITINKNPNTRDEYKEKVEARKEETRRSLEKFYSRTPTKDLSDYPEDVRPVISLFARLWNISLPRPKQKGYWIEGARDLMDACGEMEASVLRELRKDFESYMASHGGVAPYTVATPQSLVNPARAKAGLMRGAHDKPMIPPGASVVYMGGTKYE